MTYIILLQSPRHTSSHLLNVLLTTKMFTRNNIHFILSPFPEIQSCLRCLPPFNLDVRIEIVSAPATEGSFLRDYGSLGATLSAWYESLLQRAKRGRDKKEAKTKGGEWKEASRQKKMESVEQKAEIDKSQLGKDEKFWTLFTRLAFDAALNASCLTGHLTNRLHVQTWKMDKVSYIKNI